MPSGGRRVRGGGARRGLGLCLGRVGFGHRTLVLRLVGLLLGLDARLGFLGILVDGRETLGTLGLDQVAEAHVAGLLLLFLGERRVDQLLVAAGEAARADRGAAERAGLAHGLIGFDAVGPGLVPGIIEPAQRFGDPVTFGFVLARADRDLVGRG